MELGTPGCWRLAIEHLVLCAVIGAVVEAGSGDAACNAGGFGVLGTAGALPQEVRRRASGCGS
jgi:hypothetical protein